MENPEAVPMKKCGDFWVPEVEEPGLPSIAKGGAQIHHIAAALKYVTNRRTAVDVGANVGTWTRALGDVFETVVAFEPAPDTFACLEKNCQKAILHQSGLSDAPGFAQVMPDDTYPTGTGSRWLQLGNAGVPVIRFDSLNLDTVDFMKVDVEGMELRVFRGAIETLARCKPVLVVEDKARLRPRHNLDAPWEFLEALGYVFQEAIGCDRIYA